MNAYNPLESVKRLEASGFERRQAGAIASEITDGTDTLVTKSELDASLDKLLIKVGVTTGAIVGIATTVLGILITLK